MSRLNNKYKILKIMFLPVLICSLCLDCHTANAANVPPVPTLDDLHNNGAFIEGTENLYPESVYSMTKLENYNPDNPQPNTIIRYELDAQNDKYIPVYYVVNLKQNEYGNPESEEIRDIKVTVPEINGSYNNAFTFDIKYYVDKSTDEDYIDITTSSYPEAALNNSKSDVDVHADFINNKNLGANDEVFGGAIKNTGSIESINSIFISNNASPTVMRRRAWGGAIYNSGTISKITGVFINNYVNSNGNDALGGAIALHNGGNIGNITAHFIANHSYANNRGFGGAIFIANGGSTINNITGDFIGNYIVSKNHAIGGAIYNENGVVRNITGDFIKNSATASYGDANGGAIASTGEISDISGDFISNCTYTETGKANGGAIYNDGKRLGSADTTGNVVGGIINSSFINNYAKSETGIAHGGAIYTTTDINIIAKDGGKSVFSGNYVEDKDGKRQEAIYVDSKTAKLTLKAENKGSFVINDQINGVEGYNLSLDGDKTGVINLNNDVINANISLDNTNLYLGRENVFDQSQSLTLNSGSMYMT